MCGGGGEGEEKNWRPVTAFGIKPLIYWAASYPLMSGLLNIGAVPGTVARERKGVHLCLQHSRPNWKGEGFESSNNGRQLLSVTFAKKWKSFEKKNQVGRTSQQW